MLAYTTCQLKAQDFYSSLFEMDKVYKDSLFGLDRKQLKTKVKTLSKEGGIVITCNFEIIESSYIKFNENAYECNSYDCFIKNLFIDTSVSPEITILRGSKRLGSFICIDSLVYRYGRFETNSRRFIKRFYYNKAIDVIYKQALKENIIIFNWMQKCVDKIIKYEGGKLYVYINEKNGNMFIIEFENYLQQFTIDELKELVKYDFRYCNTM